MRRSDPLERHNRQRHEGQCFRHFFLTPICLLAALHRFLRTCMAIDRKVYSLTADYTWGWDTARNRIQADNESHGLGNNQRTCHTASPRLTSRLYRHLSELRCRCSGLNHTVGTWLTLDQTRFSSVLRDKQANGQELSKSLYRLLLRVDGPWCRVRTSPIRWSQNWDWNPRRTEKGDRLQRDKRLC